MAVTDRRAAPPVGGAVRLTGESEGIRTRQLGRPGAGPGIAWKVAPGEFTCLIGASGCGKSTLLSLVAGSAADGGRGVDSEGRGGGWGQVAFMFQEPALFPWLTAAGNVELALRARGVGKAERRRRTCATPSRAWKMSWKRWKRSKRGKARMNDSLAPSAVYRGVDTLSA